MELFDDLLQLELTYAIIFYPVNIRYLFFVNSQSELIQIKKSC